MRTRLEDLRRDVRYGLRLLARHRSFTLIAGLTLALGIGATSAIFSVLHASVLAPLPFRSPERLVWLEEVDGQGRARGIPVDTVEAWRGESRTLDAVSHALMGQVNFTLTGPAGAERVAFEQVDFHTFELLGVAPALGRWFRPDDVVVQGNTAQAVVISYGLWQRLFGGDPEVIGKKLPGWSAGWGEIVIGVMPRGFYTHPSRLNTDAWYVITRNPGGTIGRLAADADLDRAQAELDVLARRQTTAQPQQTSADAMWRVRVTPLHEIYRQGYARTLYMLLGAVGFVLLIAAVNVANLQLNRGVTRQNEMATRIALGAGRWRLIRQLLAENILLVMIGGALGVLVAIIGIRVFVYVAPGFYPPSDEIRVSGPVLLFTVAVCLATGLLSGMVPGMRASRPDLHATLKQGGRGTAGSTRLRIRRALVVSEIALAMVLLAGAGLMINSYARATSVDMGVNPANVLRMDVSLMGMDKYRTRHGTNHYAATAEGARFYSQVLERLARVPGVDSVGLTSVLPPGGGPPVPFRILGSGTEAAVAQYHEVSEGFFDTMRIPVIRGRVFAQSDHEGASGVVVINDAFARQHFPGVDPVGQAIQANLTGANPALDQDRQRQIVGIVGDVRMGLRSEFAPIMYIPYQQHLTDYPGFAYFGIHAIKNIVVRSSDPAGLILPVRRAFADVDATVALSGVMPMQDALSAAAGPQAFWMQLLGIFAALGLFLAAIGIYGVVSYSVAQRTHEFGIRTTLGAQKTDILRLVVRDGLVVTAVGLLIGLAGVFASTRLIENQLFGISRLDPLTIAAVALVMATVSTLACYIPARRTTKVDPLIALRVE